MKNIFITTPIYYVNDVPHIGHSYTTIIADVLSRYQRLLGNNVFFLTGTDEHGQKIEKSAEQRGLQPRELVDSVVLRYKELWEKLNISYDYFVRTTDEQHKRIVQEVFQKIYEKGYIYLGNYEGLYCSPCESYFTATQAVEGKCPDCGRDLVLLQEEAFFFKLSAFQDKLLAYIKQNEQFVLPHTRKNEVVSFIEQGLEDLCISRSSISWGIEVPELGIELKNKHYIYVWFDALLNYITAIQYMENEKVFQQHWPAYVQLIGKDILKFHCIIWPAMLMALDLELPEHVFGHGFIYQGGEKMSKSKGNVLDPNKIIEEYSVDAFRYYITREIVFGLDGTYSDVNMRQRYNSDLANDFGNLLNRTLSMMGRYFEFKVGKSNEAQLSEAELILKKEVHDLEIRIRQNMQDFKLSIVLEDIFSVIRKANKYIEDNMPWKLYKEEQIDKLSNIMIQLLETIKVVTTWLSPFMPQTAQKVYEQLNISWQEKNLYNWGYFKEGMLLNKPEPLFPRKE